LAHPLKDNRAAVIHALGSSYEEAPCVPERPTVIPQDAEFAGALADLLADESRVENVGEFCLLTLEPD
jgi:hypothetical protein